MTAKQLIEALSNIHPNMNVYFKTRDLSGRVESIDPVLKSEIGIIPEHLTFDKTEEVCFILDTYGQD